MIERSIESIIGHDLELSGIWFEVIGAVLQLQAHSYEETERVDMSIAQVDRLIAWLRDTRAVLAINANMPAVHGEGTGVPRGITPWVAAAYPGAVEVPSSGYVRRAVSMVNPRITINPDGRTVVVQN